jgi:hypothetical protein
VAQQRKQPASGKQKRPQKAKGAAKTNRQNSGDEESGVPVGENEEANEAPQYDDSIGEDAADD